MSKKNIFIIALQVVIIGVFVLIAAGSGSDGSAVSSSTRGAVQVGACAAAGYRYIGEYSNCYQACEKAGYSYSCTGDSTNSCFCK